MSQSEQFGDVSSNEEIVTSLIDNLNLKPENEKTAGEKCEHGSDDTKAEGETAFEQYIPKNFDVPEETDEEPVPNVPEDYVDEDALKELEKTLTEEEKLDRKTQALELKLTGNEQFKTGNYLESIRTYTTALQLCPLDFVKDRSILYCNRAAAKTKLQRTESAVEDCTKAIELDPNYVKAYIRRAKLYEESEKLEESLVDFKKIVEFDPGHQEANAALIRLPPIINEKNEKLKAEMLGKLKDLGNMILRPFGLSTNNFQVQQDPVSGGYSVNFQQNPGK